MYIHCLQTQSTMPEMHALYSETQRRYQKYIYVGNTVEGKSFQATELTKQRTKSYWHDGKYIGQVQTWEKRPDLITNNTEVLF